MVCSICVSVSAKEIPAERQKPLLVDEADLLSAYEESELLSKLEKISNKRECEVAVVTMSTLDGKDIVEAADDYYDYNGYGYGADDSGVLIMIDMDSREIAITTYGYGITAFTDYQIDRIIDEVSDHLSDGEYYKAFKKYADMCDDTIESARNGEIYDYDSAEAEDNFILSVLISVIIGIVAAFLGTGVMKGKLKSVRSKPAAKEYVKKDSLNLAVSKDVFLYKRTTKTKRESSSSGGGRSGGSSTHRSSSGRSHGGGRGRF